MAANAKRNIWLIVGLSLGIKLLYFLFAFTLANTGTTFESSYQYQIAHFNDSSKVVNIFYRHDAGWYEYIAGMGHSKIKPEELVPTKQVWRQSYYAFFPLYPATVKGLQLLMHCGYKNAGLLLGIIFSTASLLLFYYFTRLFTKSDTIALTSTIILCLFPFAFYISMGMTEGMFLTLLMATFIGVHNKNILLMAVCGALLVLVRPNGIVMALPLGLYFIEKHVFSGKWRWPKKADWTKLLPAFSLLSMPLIFLAYCFYLKEMTGDFFAFSTAQAGWGKYLANPFKVIFLQDGWRHWVEVGFVFFAILLGLIGLKRIPLSMHVLIALNLLLPIMAGTTTSMPRYISVIFPLFILMGIFLSKVPKVKPVAYGALLTLHLLSFYFWLLPDFLSF